MTNSILKTILTSDLFEEEKEELLKQVSTEDITSHIAEEGGEWARSYGEPGYDEKPAKGIILANWNNYPSCIQDRLENEGYELEWCDEWVIDYNDEAKAYRCSPNSYSWTQSYVIIDSDIVGRDAILEDPSEYIEWLDNDPNKAETMGLDLTKFGYQQFNGRMETGFHQGQTDDPKEVFKRIKHLWAHVIFKLDTAEQFCVLWTIWVKNDEKEDLL